MSTLTSTVISVVSSSFRGGKRGSSNAALWADSNNAFNRGLDGYGMPIHPLRGFPFDLYLFRVTKTPASFLVILGASFVLLFSLIPNSASITCLANLTRYSPSSSVSLKIPVSSFYEENLLKLIKTLCSSCFVGFF